jgi:hypothetical protein
LVNDILSKDVAITGTTVYPVPIFGGYSLPKCLDILGIKISEIEAVECWLYPQSAQG